MRALGSGADAVVADLEDAVAPAEKAAARELAPGSWREPRRTPLRLVRVNGVGTELHDADIAAAAAFAADGIVLPKATPRRRRRSARTVPRRRHRRDRAGVREAFAIASHPRSPHSCSARSISASSSGSSRGRTGTRSSCPLVGRRRLRRRRSPRPDRRRLGRRPRRRGLEGECRLGRSLGFRGKALVHPSQVPVVTRAFAPCVDELRRAREIVAAYERGAADGRGVVALDGEMIDAPVVERARRLLAKRRGASDAD